MRKDLPRSPWLLHWSMLQMPWSQSTSLHIYHSITYRISKMAKINSATRIALVTGDMRDCISVKFAIVHWGAYMLYHLSRSLGFDGISCTDIPRELFRAEDITSDHLEKEIVLIMLERRDSEALVWNRLIRLFNFIRWNCPNEALREGETAFTLIYSHWWKHAWRRLTFRV